MKILVIYTSEYGQRHQEHLRQHAPDSWTFSSWQAPTLLPPVIDYPEDYLPAELPAADLLLSVAEHKGVAELLPDIAQMTGARAVIAPVDSEAWLPRGLARQLRGWLEAAGVVCVTPKPFCSLTESDYMVSRRTRIPYCSELISEFARFFGRPRFMIQVDPETRLILSAQVERDAACGCASFVAEGLLGISADDAAEKAGLLHHHYPCRASMGKDPDFDDTLMHVSGNIFKDEVNEQVGPHKRTQYIAPGQRADD
jgi:thymidylate synthase